MNFKRLGWIVLLSLISAPSAFAQTYPHGDGKLKLYNYHLNEFAEIEFRKNGVLDPEAKRKIDRLLRSRDNEEIIPIDPNLLDLIDFIQDHFKADTVEVISGYRRKEFNEQLLKNGHAVSPVSQHTQGKAIDIHLDEIREETLRDFLLSLKLGGVGYYGPLDFVHVDTGPFRRWEEPLKGRKLIGVLNPDAPAQLTSDQNDYLPQQSPRLGWNFQQGKSLKDLEGLHLERFWHGQWIACTAKIPTEDHFTLSKAEIRCAEKGTPPLFGKYRFVFHFKGEEASLSSNEFYLKRE
ncbi:MAG: DUF882 domain-containing protein [bacterium]